MSIKHLFTLIAIAAYLAITAPSLHAGLSYAVIPFKRSVKLVYLNGRPARHAVATVEFIDKISHQTKSFTYRSDAHGVVTVGVDADRDTETNTVAYVTTPTGFGFWDYYPAHDSETITIFPLTRVRIHLIGTDHKPLSHVRIRPCSFSSHGDRAWWDEYAYSSWSSTTDAKGYAEIKGLPQGFDVQLAIDDDRYWNLLEDGAIHLAKLPVTNGKTIIAPTSGSISGTVCYGPNHKPVSGIIVRDDLSERDAAITDKNGNYTIPDVLPGSRVVQIWDRDGRFKDWVAWSQTATVTTSAKTKGVDLTLISGCIIKGKITDSKTGNPVPDAQITVGPAQYPKEQDQWSSVNSDAAGNYTVHVLPQTPGGSAHVDVRTDYSMLQKVVVSPTTPATVNFQIDSSKVSHPISGVVLEPNGKPVYSATVFIEFGLWGDCHVHAGPNGRFSTDLATVADGSRLVARSGDFASANPYVYNGQRKIILHLSAHALCSIHGTVQGSDDRPAANLTVSLSRAMGQGDTETTKSNSHGRFAFSPVIANFTYSIEATGPNYLETSGDVLAQSGKVVNISLLARKGATYAEGTILNQRGQPIPNLDIVDEDVRGAQAITDKHGHFVLESVPPGKIKITVDDSLDYCSYTISTGVRNTVIHFYQNR